MRMIPHISEALEWVLTEYPRQIERSTHFVQRSTAKLDGATFTQSLVIGWMNNPDASYTQLRHVAAVIGAHVSSQAFEQRFGPASAEMLKAILNEAALQVICYEGRVGELLERFPGVYAQDGSIVSLTEELASHYPAGKGLTKGGRRSSLRIQVRWELTHGGLEGLWLQAGLQAECSGPPAQWSSMPKGSRFIGDSGYFAYQRMAEMDAQGRWWLTSAKGDLYLYDAEGNQWTLENYLHVHGQEPMSDTWVQVGLNARVRCRLIAMRVGASTAQKRRSRVNVFHHMPRGHKGAHRLGPKPAKGIASRRKNTKSRQKHNRVSAARIRLADWTILLTNVPNELLDADEALVLMRMRWQQELLWKLWKQYGKIDSWRSEKPMRIETEIYAKLLGLLIEHWEALIGCWHDPRRSLRKAQEMTQWSASALLFALLGEMDLTRVLSIISEAMDKGCRINPRRKKPNSYQLLEHPKLIRPLG